MTPVQLLTPLVFGAGAILSLLPGCAADPPTSVPSSPVTSNQTGENAVTQQALLSKLGKGLAIALADPAMRSWIRSRIDASPYVEWRIPFRDVLLEEADRAEGRRVAQATQLTAAERGRQKALPPLELYFPIPQHRTAWKAAEPVQVAVRIGHSGSYSVYAVNGRSWVTAGDHVPSVATLVLAESEIDYTDRESAVRGGSRTGPGMDAAQARLPGPGDMALPPQEEAPPPPAPTGGSSTSRHTRLGYFKTTRYHDDWLGGRDEVEIFGSVNGGYRECASRTDVQPNRDYYFPLDNSSSTIATAIPWGTGTLYLEAFEDDDGRCLRRSSDDRYGSAFLRIEHYGLIVGTSSPGDIAIRVSAELP
ncbi:MAG TPA: hypothetical protein VJ808_13610 [Gemmatimonadales bacterium]|nr:hypothetical protein [Gemmatimonadales bacterium]